VFVHIFCQICSNDDIHSHVGQNIQIHAEHVGNSLNPKP
jgi:hypothetical protein